MSNLLTYLCAMPLIATIYQLIIAAGGVVFWAWVLSRAFEGAAWRSIMWAVLIIVLAVLYLLLTGLGLHPVMEIINR